MIEGGGHPAAVAVLGSTCPTKRRTEQVMLHLLKQILKVRRMHSYHLLLTPGMMYTDASKFKEFITKIKSPDFSVTSFGGHLFAGVK